jgi:hypothetical protein
MKLLAIWQALLLHTTRAALLMCGVTLCYLCCLCGQGRDANRKLQRAIKAKKLRERLPGLLVEVRSRLAEWRDSEGAPFTYDGRDYEVRRAAAVCT